MITKNCPFCNGTPKIFARYDCIFVECTCCGAKIKGVPYVGNINDENFWKKNKYVEENAIKRWNTRVNSDMNLVKEEISELQSLTIKIQSVMEQITRNQYADKEELDIGNYILSIGKLNGKTISEAYKQNYETLAWIAQTYKGKTPGKLLEIKMIQKFLAGNPKKSTETDEADANYVLSVGKMKGKTIKHAYDSDKNWLQWLINKYTPHTQEQKEEVERIRKYMESHP